MSDTKGIPYRPGDARPFYADGTDRDRHFGLKALVDDKTLEQIQESLDVCPECGRPLDNDHCEGVTV